MFLKRSNILHPQALKKTNCAGPALLSHVETGTPVLGLLDKEVYGTGQLEAAPGLQFYLAGSLRFS